MKRKFDTEVRVESRYNQVPEGMRTVQFGMCSQCEYRITRMQYAVAEEEARQKGGSPRNYLGGFYIKAIPLCKRRKTCLIDSLTLTRVAKATSPNQKLIKLKKLTIFIKELK